MLINLKNRPERSSPRRKNHLPINANWVFTVNVCISGGLNTCDPDTFYLDI